jgi:hypothetical protein
MEINSCRIVTKIGTGTQEESGRQPQSELQPDFSVKNVVKVRKVLMEEVKDSPLKLQLEGVPHEVVESVIEPPHDL